MIFSVVACKRVTACFTYVMQWHFPLINVQHCDLREHRYEMRFLLALGELLKPALIAFTSFRIYFIVSAIFEHEGNV